MQGVAEEGWGQTTGCTQGSLPIQSDDHLLLRQQRISVLWVHPEAFDCQSTSLPGDPVLLPRCLPTPPTSQFCQRTSLHSFWQCSCPYRWQHSDLAQEFGLVQIAPPCLLPWSGAEWFLVLRTSQETTQGTAFRHSCQPEGCRGGADRTDTSRGVLTLHPQVLAQEVESLPRAPRQLLWGIAVTLKKMFGTTPDCSQCAHCCCFGWVIFCPLFVQKGIRVNCLQEHFLPAMVRSSYVRSIVCSFSCCSLPNSKCFIEASSMLYSWEW